MAGADPLRGDPVGGLAVSKSGLTARDARVAQWCAGARGRSTAKGKAKAVGAAKGKGKANAGADEKNKSKRIPLVAVLAGGYSAVQDVVDVHHATLERVLGVKAVAEMESGSG